MNLLTTQDVAELFRVQPKVVYRWRAQGAPLRGFRAGTRRLYTEDEVTAFIDWLRQQEADQPWRQEIPSGRPAEDPESYAA